MEPTQSRPSAPPLCHTARRCNCAPSNLVCKQELENRMEQLPAIAVNPQNLRELSPIPVQLGRNPALNHPALATHDSVLRDYLRVLIKRKWLVLGSLALVFGGSLIATLRTTPIYDAVGSIAINKPDPMLQSIRDSGNVG